MRTPPILRRCAVLLAALAAVACAQQFPLGVASGDVTSTSAVLWTRANREAQLTLEISTDPGFRQTIQTQTVAASSARDFTIKAVAAGLSPATAYFYRFRSAGAASDTGSFKTAPSRSVSSGVRFAYSGDTDGILVNGAPAFNHFEALDAARAEGLDFFVYLGDTIYADSEFRSSPARALDDYRDAYRVNRQVPALRNLLQAASTYSIWDDHELRDNFDGQTVDRTQFAGAREAFLEYLPVRELSFPDRLSCAGDPLFRLYHWGKDIDLIIPDERSCRSGDAQAACTNAAGPDLAPALPPLLRFAAGLPPSPPPGCLETLRDPSRTMLGYFQKLVFKSALLYSKAKFKFVINEVPIQQLYAFPYDRWEGYAAERSEILNFIRDNRIQNVIFLTTDLHANLINQVFIDRLTDPEPIADEFITGPIATDTLEKAIAGVLSISPATFNELAGFLGVSCANLDAYSYGLVEVDSKAGTATITLKDDHGNPLRSQANPDAVCAKTIGP